MKVSSCGCICFGFSSFRCLCHNFMPLSSCSNCGKVMRRKCTRLTTFSSSFFMYPVCEKKAALAERDELETLTPEKSSKFLRHHLSQRSMQEFSRGPSTNAIGAFTSYSGDLTASMPDNEAAPFASSFSAPPSQQHDLESKWESGLVTFDGSDSTPVPVPIAAPIPGQQPQQSSTGSLRRILVDSSVMERMPF